jgi:hypothetical protein
MIQIAVWKSVCIDEHDTIKFRQKKNVKLFKATSIVTIVDVTFKAGKSSEDSSLSFPIFEQL